MNIVVRRKLVPIILIAALGWGVLVAASAVRAGAAAGAEGCAGKVFVTNSDGTVSVITTATGAVAAPVSTATARGGVGLTPDGKHVYVPNSNDGTVSVIDTATGAVSPNSIIVGNGPVGLTVTPDGKRVYVANAGDNTVSVITTATGAVSPPITVGNGPIFMAICPARGTHNRR